MTKKTKNNKRRNPPQSQRPSVLSIAGSALGFVFVAFLSAMAGYSLSNPGLSSAIWGDVEVILIYMLLLIPYYYTRQEMLENANEGSGGRHDVYAILIGLTVILLLFSALIFIFFSTEITFPEDWLSILWPFIFSIFPFYLLMGKSLVDLRQGASKAFTFSNKVFLPALATGIMPFSFGWSLSNGSININGVLFAAVYVAALVFVPEIIQWMLPSQLSNKINERLDFSKGFTIATSVLIFLGVIISSSVFKLEQLNAVIYGSLITFAMGVSETVKRVFMMNPPRRAVVKDEDQTFYIRGANWSSVVFPLFVIFIPLFITHFRVRPILVFMSVQIIIWLLLPDRLKTTRLGYVYGLVFGYGLPLLIIITNLFYAGPSVERMYQNPFSIPIVMLGLGLAALNLLGVFDKFLNFLVKFYDLSLYRDRENSFFLFFTTAYFIILLLWLIQRTPAFDQIRNRVFEVGNYLSYLLMFLGFVFFIRLASLRVGKSNGGKK